MGIITKKIIDKLDGILQFQKSFIQLQHALYPHLVPAERTVHRKKPRNIVFNAIRWVNPHRYFPLMDTSPEEIGRMNREQITEMITQIHAYRQEAQSIHNRYNMMRWNIQQGKTPYPILWPEKKWMTLDERMDRCMDLTNGTVIWENQIDKIADVIRSNMQEKHKMDIDDVPELWGRNGEMHPAFRSLKGGRDEAGNYKRYLRTSRRGEGVSEATGKRKRSGKPQERGAFTDEARFRAPAPETVREGEQVQRYQTDS